MKNIIRYKAYLLAFILSLYILPPFFTYGTNTGLDGSWVRAINLAIKKHLQFGTDFIFTFGPLGFLSTRYQQLVPLVDFLVLDLFVIICFSYIVGKFLQRNIGWGWFLISFFTVLYFKGTECTQTLFLFFLIFAILNFRNNFNNYFEIICCGICGIVVFFIKINYGLISLPILLSLVIAAAFVNRKAALLLLFSSVAVFLIIYASVNINIVNYIRFGLPIIGNYAEAMVLELSVNQDSYISAILCLIIFGYILIRYLKNVWATGAMSFISIYSVLLLSLMMFLMYKNGFTRNDAHSDGFFRAVPFFLLISVFLLDLGGLKIMKILCIACLLISDYNLPLPHADEGKGFAYNVLIKQVVNYFSTVLKKENEVPDPSVKIPEDKLRLIGNSTIDIIPVDIATLQQNNLNYDPRPVIQSYSAYSPVLDSLNAQHFFQSTRPEYVMMKVESIDNRYPAWDESITKATLRLNYDDVNFVSLDKDTSLTNSSRSFLLLKSKKDVQIYPRFEKLYERIINLEDTFQINFADDSAYYVSISIEYNNLGKIKNLIFQPPLYFVTLGFDPSCKASITQRIIRPVLKEPLLINKVITTNNDFKSFMMGNLKAIPSIKAFAIHALGRGTKPKIKVTFFKFVNYY